MMIDNDRGWWIPKRFESRRARQSGLKVGTRHPPLARVILGRAANGRTEWKDKQGRELKAIQEADAKS